MTTLAEYLNTNYDADREYIDGEIFERNWGEKAHSTIQGEIVVRLHRRAKELAIEVLLEQRVQVSPTRIRVPDVTVLLLPETDEPIVTSPPHLCIEILSPHDTMQHMLEKIDDYLNFGVPYIWIINPRSKKAYVVTRAGMVEASSGVLETKDPAISVPLSVLFD